MLQCQRTSINKQRRLLYLAFDGKEQHCDVEPRHDEEIKNAILKKGSHQAGHARLALISLELEDEDNKANKGNNICNDVRFLNIRETVDNRYRRAQFVTCRPTRWHQGR